MNNPTPSDMIVMSDQAEMITCPHCGEPGRYWEDRVPVHDSIIGFEIRTAGIEHPDGRFCDE